jgi:hypothetical protein
MALIFCRPPCIQQTPDPLPPSQGGGGGGGDNTCCFDGTAITTIKPFSTTASYLRYQPVQYNGHLFVANGPITPGPFDPSEWTDLTLDNDGGLNVVTTVDGDTINFSGLGTAGSPLSAEVIVSGDPDNILVLGPDGLFVPPADILLLSSGRTIWLDQVNGDDANQGEISSPVGTLTRAMALATPNDVIRAYPGTYTDSITNWKENVLLEGFGSEDSISTLIRGHQRTTLTRMKMKNIQLIGTTLSEPTLLIDNSMGRHYLDNVSISHVGGDTETSIEFVGNNQNWFTMIGGSIEGLVSIDDTLQISPFQPTFIGGFGTPRFILSRPPVTLSIVDRILVGHIQHDNGALFLKNIGVMVADGSGESLVSTAITGFGALFMQNTNFLQVDGSWGDLHKTGNAPRTMFGISYDPATPDSDLNGGNILGYQARDIYGNYDDPVNYDILGPTLQDHLEGIDLALANMALGKKVPIGYAFSATNNWSNNEVLFAYVMEDAAEIPANLDGSQAFVQSSVLLTTNVSFFRTVPGGAKTGIGNLSFVNSVPTFSGAGAAFDVGDILSAEVYANNNFDYVAITVQGQRIVTYIP